MFGEAGDALLLEGVAGALGGLFAVWAIMASLNRHFTSSACERKSYVNFKGEAESQSNTKLHVQAKLFDGTLADKSIEN